LIRSSYLQDMLLFKDKINYKQPGGNGFHAHLDAPAYDHISRIEHVTVNLAIDPATPENGCLEVVPGSHKMEVKFAHGGRIKPEWEHTHEWIPIPLEPGDMLIFGSHLAHRSAANKTDKSRSSLYATFHSRSDGEDLRERYYMHRMEMFPPEHGESCLPISRSGNSGNMIANISCKSVKKARTTHKAT
jgi:ectoine hydroxylase-related dioxygenase (phytanoyl-CoA dioxygenase family)